MLCVLKFSCVCVSQCALFAWRLCGGKPVCVAHLCGVAFHFVFVRLVCLVVWLVVLAHTFLCFLCGLPTFLHVVFIVLSVASHELTCSLFASPHHSGSCSRLWLFFVILCVAFFVHDSPRCSASRCVVCSWFRGPVAQLKYGALP